MAELTVPSEQLEISTQLTVAYQERAVDIGVLEDVDSSDKKSKQAKRTSELRIVQDGQYHCVSVNLHSNPFIFIYS